MAEIVNLRIARKRAARSKAEGTPPNSGSPMAPPNRSATSGGGPRQGPPNSRSASNRTRRPSMKSPVIKRSIVIAGHKTSVSLEDAFWKGLKEIADDRNVTLSDLFRPSIPIASTAISRRPSGCSCSTIIATRVSGSRARGTSRPDRVAGGDLSSASRVTAAAPASVPVAAQRFRRAARRAVSAPPE